MLEFKKYSSIENSFSKEFMERVVAEMPTDLEYVVQEKVHGANTSFLCDGESVRFAKRTSLLEQDEKFYDYAELLERYREKVVALTKEVMGKYSDTRSISIFGEMFGGTYPHKEVQPNRKMTAIQKGVCYTPGHEFYAFDIYVIGDGGGRYLSVDEANELFEKHGFFYARTLFQIKALGASAREIPRKKVEELYELRRKLGLPGKHPANVCLNALQIFLCLCDGQNVRKTCDVHSGIDAFSP